VIQKFAEVIRSDHIHPMKLHTIAAAAFLSLAACASTQSAKTERFPADPNDGRDAAMAEMMKNFERVRFAFDSSLITVDTQEALAQNVEIMKMWPEIELEVEGHCDEVGSTEYNMALGQRRAEGIKRYMATAGVPEARIATVSFGEEVPLAAGESSDAMSENRRAEFRVMLGGDKAQGTVASNGKPSTFARR
jgi:peptidoglycan-associated lipoprotein